eukprot:GEMP01038664.1.p1 GENE.GEMP01038664.1~~GEMP01038664.1.p1  ORF type:complete len:244 (+),score=50.19 GEMP01038664.1:146-877(+)
MEAAPVAAVPGWEQISAMLNEARSETLETVTIEDEDNDNVWVVVQDNPTYKFWTKVRKGRKLVKSAITMHSNIQEALGCFFHINEDTPTWDDTYLSVKLVKDYHADGNHADKLVVSDQVWEVNMQMPFLFRMFVRVPTDLKLRFVLSKEDDDSYTGVVMSWNLEKNERNLDFKVRKYGKIQQVDNQTTLTSVEKSGRWVPDWLLGNFALSGATRLVTKKMANYKKFLADSDKSVPIGITGTRM